MRLLRPSSVLLTADCLRTDVVLAVPEPGELGEPQWRNELDCQGPFEDYSGELWTAPPLMMHAHLESWDAPSSEWPRESFSAWVGALLRWRVQENRMPAAESAKRSWRELQTNGCGAVLTSASEAVDDVGDGSTVLDPNCNPGRPQCRVATEWFQPDPEHASQWNPPARSSVVALHSPFGVSEDLATAAFQWQQQSTGRALTLHLGEHADERRYLRDHEGPLADLLTARGRQLKAQKWASPVDWLEEVAPGKRKGVFAVHCGDLSVEELQRLHAKQIGMVWCPGTHQYFDRPTPAFARAGLAAPMLGCDSRASNSELNPLRELRIARQVLPQYSAADWWRAATEQAQYHWGLYVDSIAGAPTSATLPLRFSDPNLSSAAEVCDYLTSEEKPHPLASPGIPALA
jgi:cytosine/adenosine deaminase-related metal-dependent hydrolase